MPLFDAYVFVDWSAANGTQAQEPVAHAVWSAELIPELNYQQEKYHPTRQDCVTHITDALLGHVKEKRRVLVGFDFPYGYPAGFTNALGLPAGPQSWWLIWAELAARVEDTVDNVNNRFVAAGELNTIAGNGQPGPFWGCPVGTEVEYLQTHSPGFPFAAASGTLLQRLRLVETRLPRIQDAWGLFGPGRVGSQALVGIPYIYRIRRHPELVWLGRVWPFETQFTPRPLPAQGPFILHAEIWPGVVEQIVQQLLAATPELIRDRAQVRIMCEWAAELDEQDELGGYFAQPNGLTAQQVQTCVEQEGWILGAT